MNTANEIDNVRLVVLDIHHRIANVATELNLASEKWDEHSPEYRQHLASAWRVKLRQIGFDVNSAIDLLK